VIRDSVWLAGYCRSAYRGSIRRPTLWSPWLGFRVVLAPGQP
jgi:hypothetical protein